MATMVDLSGLADFTPYEGMGSGALLKQDGFFKVQLAKLTLGKSKNGNEKFDIACVVQDEDEKGATVYANVTFGGTDAKGKPNIRKLGELLMSVGTSLEAVRSMAARGNFDVETLVPLLTGKIAHVECAANEYEGRTTSRVENFVAPDRFASTVAAGAHRRPHKIAQSFTGAPAGATATGAMTLPSAATIAVTGKVTNGVNANAALDALAGLGL